MISIQEQIQAQHEEKQRLHDEFYYVDYCNNCRTGLSSKYDIPCHHSWYCWHNEDVSSLQTEIIRLTIKNRLTTQEYYKLKKLKNRRYKIIQKKLKEWRKTQ